MKFLVTADFHGNVEHMKQLQEAVKQYKPDVFVYVGDLGPAKTSFSTPIQQCEWVIESMLVPMSQLEIKYKFCMAGNTDYEWAVQQYASRFNSPNILKFVQTESFQLEDLNLIFLPKIGYSKKCLKDGELFEKFSSEKFDVHHVFSKSEFSNEGFEFVANNTLQYNTKYFQIFDNFDSVTDEFKAKLQPTIYDSLAN